MSEVQRNALRGVDGLQRGRDVPGKPEIAHMQMQRVRYPCRRYATLQPGKNLTRGNPIFWHFIIKSEGPQILLARADAARIGAFDPNGAGRGKRRAYIGGDCAIILALAYGVEQKVSRVRNPLSMIGMSASSRWACKA